MKRIFLAVLLVVLLSACGSKNSSEVEVTITGDKIVEVTEETTTEKSVEKVHELNEKNESETETIIEKPVEVNWQELKYKWEDEAGYSFEATIQVSPWINTKNEDYLHAAWEKVGKTKHLTDPDYKSWGINCYGSSYQGDNNNSEWYICRFEAMNNITDYYYCVGDITIKNITNGWNITAAAPITSNPIILSACQPESAIINKQDAKVFSTTISRVLYGETEKLHNTFAIVRPKYTSNKWGPTPFIFAHFDNKTPANPDGEYISEIKESCFCLTRDLGIGMSGREIFEESEYVKLDVID